MSTIHSRACMCCIGLASILVAGCEPRTRSTTGTVAGHRYFANWQEVDRNGRTLVRLVVIPKGIPIPTVKYSHPSSKNILPRGLDFCGRQLHVDGLEIPADDEHIVLVYQRNRSVTAVPLATEVRQSITRYSIEALDRLPVWKSVDAAIKDASRNGPVGLE